MRFLILSGLSGAGKSSALRFLEDSGYLCVDNLPPMLIGRFIEMCAQNNTRLSHVALVVDIRSGSFFDGDSARIALEAAQADGIDIKVLYMEATDETLITRYKETRRDHPLASDEVSLTEAIALEREKLQPLREVASYVVDTSLMRPRDTAQLIAQLLGSRGVEERGLRVEVQSFGFKRGIPRESDLVLDVRFLPNPFYLEDIRLFTGLEAPVREFVLGHEVTQTFLQKTYDMLTFLLPHYRQEGKHRLMIAIGCTGGAHRSVAIAEAIGAYLREKGTIADVNHRDIELEKTLWMNAAGRL